MSITLLREAFEKDFKVTSVDALTSEDVERWLSESVIQHNSRYSEDASDLPTFEYQLVVLLAGSRLFMHRASKFAVMADLKGPNSVESDRSSPFDKCTKMAKTLSDNYKIRCAQMGIMPGGSAADGVSQVLQGTLTKTSINTGARIPYYTSPPITSAFLKATKKDATTVVLEWTPSRESGFFEYRVFLLDSASDPSLELYSPWETDGSYGTPKINTLAQNLVNLVDPEQTSVKVVDLTAGVKYAFVIVTAATNFKYSYSNQVEIQM